MGISLSVTTRGIPSAIARMQRTKGALIDALRDATEEGADLTADFVREFTPVMLVNRGGSDRTPGELKASVRSDVDVRESGRVVGRVWTDKEWGPFVEHGTVQHGRGRHMFQLGARSARPLVTAIFREHIARATH